MQLLNYYLFIYLINKQAESPGGAPVVISLALRRCETLWSAREIASMALSVASEIFSACLARSAEGDIGDGNVENIWYLSLAPPRAPLKLSLSHSIVFHVCFTSLITDGVPPGESHVRER